MQISNGIEHGSIDGLYICIYIYMHYIHGLLEYIYMYICIRIQWMIMYKA
jgi:hypothetical protein